MRNDLCVLVAEDEPDDVYLLQVAFEDAGIRNPMHVVPDGAEAINYLSGSEKYRDRTEFPFPALLILDLKMPRKTGLDVLAWLRNDGAARYVPVIVFSSSAHPSDVTKAYDLGANAFVVKPSGMAERNEFAKMIKGFWLTLNVPPPETSSGEEA